MKKTDWKLCLRLFLTYLKIGAFTFGGGYAMIPLIQRDVVEKNKWITDDELLEMIAIAESTPGPIAINTATFVGYRLSGVFGAFCATMGVVLPSFIIISLISALLTAFSSLKPVRYAFFGIRAGVLALILKALWSMFRKTKKSVFAYIVMSLALIAVAFLKIDALWVIIACAVIGLVYSLYARRKCK